MEMNMLSLSGFGGLILLALDVWALVSIIGSRASNGRKAIWLLLVFFLPLVGFLIWLIAGPKSAASHA